MTETNRGFFISGSDTGVGKTYITCQLIRQLQQQNIRVNVRKPVESGCEEIEGKLFPSDGYALQQACTDPQDLDIITPYRFRAALAPDRAARLEGQKLALMQLYKASLKQPAVSGVIMVEGAGGFYSPIAEDGLNADLAKKLALSVIIVIADRLGAINQALLTLSAVEHEGLSTHAIILNQCHKNTAAGLKNLNDLRKRTSTPVFQCRYGETLQQQIV